MLVNLLREGLGRVIIFISWLFRPQQIMRSPEQQALVNEQIKSMTLYQFYACPFCIKTRRALYRLNLPIKTREVHKGSPYRHELEQGGGRIQVPCLRVHDENNDVWMYESSDIIRYLERQFGQVQADKT